jgi:hypothetical protein
MQNDPADVEIYMQNDLADVPICVQNDLAHVRIYMQNNPADVESIDPKSILPKVRQILLQIGGKDASVEASVYNVFFPFKIGRKKVEFDRKWKRPESTPFHTIHYSPLHTTLSQLIANPSASTLPHSNPNPTTPQLTPPPV